MKKYYVVSAITFILFLIGSGAFSLAEEKKTVSPPPVNIQQGCSEDEKKNLGPDNTTAPTVIREDQTTNPASLTPPSVKIQEETEAEG